MTGGVGTVVFDLEEARLEICLQEEVILTGECGLEFI
jgi:hypothetical protein